MVFFGSASGSPLKEVRDPSTYTALVYTPPDTTAPVPMLLYLHGAGECGSKIWGIIAEGASGTPPVELHFGRGLPALAEQFCVVAPQSTGGWQAAKVAKFMEWLLKGGAKDGAVPQIDPSRCYCTGHCMGGSGALDAGTTGLFAAIAPVAPGGGDTAHLKGVPCWLFHGANDVVLPVRCSERAYAALRSLNGEELVKLTVYENAPDPPGYPSSTGHAATIPAYATVELYAWLLSHVKGA